MGRFNVLNWTPRSDSSDGVDYQAIGRNPETDLVLLRPSDKSCNCGCQQLPASKGRRFAMGHDARLRGKLIRAHLTGTPITVVTGGAPEEGTAMQIADRLGWSKYLKDAERKQGPTIRAKLEGANRRVLAAAVGPQVGDRRVVKVGRWDYTGQILAIYDDGGRFEVEYVTAKGDLKRSVVPADKVGELEAQV